MVKIRLARFGRKKAPFYRIVATPTRSKREGMPLEVLGFWNPVKKELKIESEKLKAWIEKGAQISPNVAKLLKEFK